MEFKGFPQFERDFASFSVGLLAAFVVAAFVPLAATPLSFAATTCALARIGRGLVRESGSFQLLWAATSAALLAALFVIDFVPFYVSLLWNTGKLVGHAAVLPRSGPFCVLGTIHDTFSSL